MDQDPPVHVAQYFVEMWNKEEAYMISPIEEEEAYMMSAIDEDSDEDQEIDPGSG